MTIVIMAAGMGSRFGGLKQITPLTDDNEFIIDFTVYDAIRAGFDKVVFVIREEHREIFDEMIGAKLRRAGIDFRYAYQKPELPAGFEYPKDRKKPFGTGHAVLSVGKIDEPFAVVNSDDFYGAETFSKLSSFLKSADEGCWCMVGYKVKNTLSPNGSVSRGICVTDENGMLKSITEYKKIERAGTRIINTFPDGSTADIENEQLVSMTCFGFTPSFCDSLKELFVKFLNENASDLSVCEFYLPNAVQSMIDAGVGKMAVLDTDSEWRGVTYKDDSDEFRAFIRKLKSAGKYPKELF